MRSKQSRLHIIYTNMKSRCYNPNNKNYSVYGGRGITVCKEWINKKRVGQGSLGWYAFKEWALSNGYSDELTIDRIDVNKGYSPNNCRWVSMKVQLNNMSSNIYIIYNGRKQTLSQWCNELGLNYDATYKRIHRNHWPIEKAFSTKLNYRFKEILYNGKKQCLSYWCKELNLNYHTVTDRLKHGWSIEKAFENTTPSQLDNTQ